MKQKLKIGIKLDRLNRKIETKSPRPPGPFNEFIKTIMEKHSTNEDLMKL